MLRTKTSPDRSGGRSPGWGPKAGVGLLVLTPTMAAIWLFLAAVPALADGGPHVKTINDGSLGINADSCAGCHRAHTAKGPYLINAVDEEALCLTCHGSGGVGSTVDVMTGVQYKIALAPGSAAQNPDGDPSPLLGALRNGGFDKARIDAGEAARRRFGTGRADFYAKVRVGAPEDVTSSHVGMDANGLTMPGIAWGNGSQWTQADPTAPYPGPAVADLSCASCHNPHGNGQFRILVPIPVAEDRVPDPDVPDFAADTADNVMIDSPVVNPDPGDTSSVKNYTVIQRYVALANQANPQSYLLYAEDVTDLGYGPTLGDYFHRYVPWNPASALTRMFDAPNGRPSTFNTQMTNWCVACHTRYYSVSAEIERADPSTGEPDSVYRYQHQTIASTVCTTCHVSHGTNAAMGGNSSASASYPDGTVPATGSAVDNGNSRLLKIDNRGTCQACHDPADTTVPGDYDGPLPSPGTP